MAVKYPRSQKYNFNKNLVKRHKLVGYLDRYLSKEVTDFKFEYKPKEADDAWHPSGHCTDPPEALYNYATTYLSGNFTTKEWGVEMLKTFLVGHFWHQLLQKAVLDLGFAQPEHIEVRGSRVWGKTVGFLNIHPGLEGDPAQKSLTGIGEPFHWATGAGDVAPCSIPKYGDYVVDFKTMGGYQFKTAGIPEFFAEKYEAQINIYMDFFDLEKGLIVAIQKDSPHEMKEFEFERNQELIDVIYDKWQFVSECLDEGEPPTRLDNDAFQLPFTGPIAQ